MEKLAFTFDLGGVTHIGGNTQRMMRSLHDLSGIEYKILDKIIFSNTTEKLPEQKALFRGEISIKEFFQWSFDFLKIDLEPDNIITQYVESFKINFDTLDIIKRLGELGYNTMYATNRTVLSMSIMKLIPDYLNVFTHMGICSQQLGSEKPNYDFYQAVYDQWNKIHTYNADQIIMIDDKPQYIEGAKQFSVNKKNMQGIVYNNSLSLKQHLQQSYNIVLI